MKSRDTGEELQTDGEIVFLSEQPLSLAERFKAALFGLALEPKFVAQLDQTNTRVWRACATTTYMCR